MPKCKTRKTRIGAFTGGAVHSLPLGEQRSNQFQKYLYLRKSN